MQSASATMEAVEGGPLVKEGEESMGVVQIEGPLPSGNGVGGKHC